MRSLAALAALLLIAPAAAEFGSGPATFVELAPATPIAAPEPTIGIPWTTDNVFYLAGDTTFRVTFDGDNATWTDVSPIGTTPVNLDPMLIADELTGRILTGGLVGPCSIMYYSDDDGNTWLPSLNMCSGAQFDHQSVGLGPKPLLGNPLGIPQALNGYYCGQLALIGCSVSLDGGVTWTPPTPAVVSNVLDGCGGFHGHWRTSTVTGAAFLPVGACGDQRAILVPDVAGLAGTEIAGLTGLTFGARLVEGSHAWDGGFDASIGVSKESGWVYFGDADHLGARMALSKDEGFTWEDLGGTTWLDVGAFHDPPIVYATFADVQAGDDDRVAFTFLGLEDLDGDGLPHEYGSGNTTNPRDLYDCEPTRADGVENRVWHYYAAFSYDAGVNWTVTKITDHPVQIGGVWDGGGGNPCRNLLDFNDMDIDSMGRIHIAWADGCIDVCYDPESGEHTYTRDARLFRQTGGMGLFAQYDTDPSEAVLDSDGDGIPDDEDDTPFGEPESEDSPAAFLAVLALIGVAVLRRR